MNAPEPAPQTDEKPARRRKPSTEKRRNPEQRVMLTVMPDGSFRAADQASRNALRARGFHKGQPVIAYLYRVRDGAQWRRAHALGRLLTENVDAFIGMEAHAALKKIQLDGSIACEVEKIDLKDLGVFTRTVPKSLAFGEMDDAEFSSVFKQMCEHVTKTYFPDMDADAVAEMLDVMEQH